jgi:hypothetical protein
MDTQMPVKRYFHVLTPCRLPHFGSVFSSHFLRYRELGSSLDMSRMKFPEDFFEKMQRKIKRAFESIDDQYTLAE